jgi:cytochrome c peroxidase
LSICAQRGLAAAAAFAAAAFCVGGAHADRTPARIALGKSLFFDPLLNVGYGTTFMWDGRA